LTSLVELIAAHWVNH